MAGVPAAAASAAKCSSARQVRRDRRAWNSTTPVWAPAEPARSVAPPEQRPGRLPDGQFRDRVALRVGDQTWVPSKAIDVGLSNP